MNHRILRNVTLLLAASLAPAVIAAAQDASVHSAPAARIPTAGYLGAAALEARLNQLVSQNSKTCALATLAKSPGGRPVWLLTLAAEGEQPSDERTALLLVGGADGDSPVSVAAALGVAERLLAAAASAPDGPESKLLRERVIHVVPCLNPDAYEAFFAPVQRERRLNESPTDSDRDGRADEDGPNDLNGDGLITVMRIRDPQGPWMIDPDEPRLMRKADRGKGERGEFLLQLEGLDDDGDGAINEDEPGGVDLDRNFPHFFESGVAAAGIHQVCEPETRALAEFVITNPHIAAAFVYGRDDNLLSVPKGQARGPEGRSYRDLHPEDIKVYEFLAERFKEKTGLKGAGGCRPEGALYAWLYSQQAIPTFAINPWWPPEGKPASQPAGDAATQPSSAAASGPASRAQPADEPPTPAESPAAEAAEPAAPAPQATPPPGRGRGGRGAFRGPRRATTRLHPTWKRPPRTRPGWHTSTAATSAASSRGRRSRTRSTARSRWAALRLSSTPLRRLSSSNPSRPLRPLSYWTSPSACRASACIASKSKTAAKRSGASSWSSSTRATCPRTSASRCTRSNP